MESKIKIVVFMEFLESFKEPVIAAATNIPLSCLMSRMCPSSWATIVIATPMERPPSRENAVDMDPLHMVPRLATPSMKEESEPLLSMEKRH